MMAHLLSALLRFPVQLLLLFDHAERNQADTQGSHSLGFAMGLRRSMESPEPMATGTPAPAVPRRRRFRFLPPLGRPASAFRQRLEVGISLQTMLPDIQPLELFILADPNPHGHLQESEQPQRENESSEAHRQNTH